MIDKRFVYLLIFLLIVSIGFGVYNSIKVTKLEKERQRQEISGKKEMILRLDNAIQAVIQRQAKELKAREDSILKKIDVLQTKISSIRYENLRLVHLYDSIHIDRPEY